ncbi:MAG: hypothetical protein ABIH78_02415 [Candidatus Peregrinibacteria bacterium]
MAIFNYTVANKEGKKLSGTVEAPDEQTARAELNNLGFSILVLKMTESLPTVPENLTKFEFEAVDKNSKLVSGSIPAENEEEAYKKLTSQYALTVTAIWKDGASETEIETSRKEGTARLQQAMAEEVEVTKMKNLKEQKEEQFIKTKIEYILGQVNELLVTFDKEFDIEKKSEINKRINKLLRIKSSKNTGYILSSAEDLLKYIQTQEKELLAKDHQEAQFDLQVKTRKLLDELNKTSKPHSVAEDIVEKIDTWESSHTSKEKSQKPTTRFLSNFLLRIKNIFKTPEELQIIKDQIKVYNHQLFEFAKLYFKEPTPQYREKVKNSLKTIWNTRKKAIHSLSHAKKLLKKRSSAGKIDEHVFMSFLEELNLLTGWLIALYIAYYFISLYITTKNFGLSTIPKVFFIYDSHIFKYILVILFLLHATTALKVNFFKKSILANIILFPIFIFGSIIVLLNF